jgi:HK97 gp10 family phage protein
MALERSTIRGAKELDAVLKKLPPAIAKKVLPGAVMTGAQVVRRAAKARAPDSGAPAKLRKRKATAKNYGKLKDNIIARRDRRDMSASVTVRVGIGRAFWGIFSEFGTSKQSARPWFRPAWEESKRRALDAIGKSLGRRLEKAAVRLAGPFAKSGLARRRRR